MKISCVGWSHDCIFGVAPNIFFKETFILAIASDFFQILAHPLYLINELIKK